MVSKVSELQRMNKKLFEEIKKKQAELQNVTKTKISFPQASESFYEEFKELKMKVNRKGEIKF